MSILYTSTSITWPPCVRARGTSYPDPGAASLCEMAGADGITVHLREDRRHIQDRDVELAAADRARDAEPGDGGDPGDGGQALILPTW